MQLKEFMSFESESINENVFFVKGNVHCFGNPRRKRILFALDKFRKLDLRIEENKERLIDGLVKAIIVYDDHFEVFLTFDDTPITIPTSEEIESKKKQFGHRICHFTKKPCHPFGWQGFLQPVPTSDPAQAKRTLNSQNNSACAWVRKIRTAGGSPNASLRQQILRRSEAETVPVGVTM